MQCGPLADESQGTSRQIAGDGLARGDVDLRPVLAVLSVEVRRRMVGPVHPDADAVKGADLGRHSIMSRACDASLARPGYPGDLSVGQGRRDGEVIKRNALPQGDYAGDGEHSGRGGRGVL